MRLSARSVPQRVEHCVVARHAYASQHTTYHERSGLTVPDVEEDDKAGDEGALRRKLLVAVVQDRIQVRPGCDRSRYFYHISLTPRPSGFDRTLVWVHRGTTQ